MPLRISIIQPRFAPPHDASPDNFSVVGRAAEGLPEAVRGRVGVEVEVIVHIWEQEGADFPSHFEGRFAIGSRRFGSRTAGQRAQG